MKYCSSCGGRGQSQDPGRTTTRERWVCDACGTVHYQNPLIVVGCVAEQEGKVLLCKRAIEPRYGYWTVPAGFMELGESLAGGAARETLEEACATVELGAAVRVGRRDPCGPGALFLQGQAGRRLRRGHETPRSAMFAEDEIPWDDIAFSSGEFALRKYFEDRGENRGVHFHELRRFKGP